MPLTRTDVSEGGASVFSLSSSCVCRSYVHGPRSKSASGVPHIPSDNAQWCLRPSIHMGISMTVTLRSCQDLWPQVGCHLRVAHPPSPSQRLNRSVVTYRCGRPPRRRAQQRVSGSSCDVAAASVELRTRLQLVDRAEIWGGPEEAWGLWDRPRRSGMVGLRGNPGLGCSQLLLPPIGGRT